MLLHSPLLLCEKVKVCRGLAVLAALGQNSYGCVFAVEELRQHKVFGSETVPVLRDQLKNLVDVVSAYSYAEECRSSLPSLLSPRPRNQAKQEGALGFYVLKKLNVTSWKHDHYFGKSQVRPPPLGG